MNNAAIILMQSLVEKLEALHKSEDYKTAWKLMHLHFGIYKGPNYANELQACRSFLHELRYIEDEQQFKDDVATEQYLNDSSEEHLETEIFNEGGACL